jgi:hypothetical protein
MNIASTQCLVSIIPAFIRNLGKPEAVILNNAALPRVNPCSHESIPLQCGLAGAGKQRLH